MKHEQNRRNETKPIKTKVNQNQSRKTLKPILATRWNQTATLLIKETLLSKSRELENLLAEKILTKNFILKSATAKNWIWFSKLNDKTKLANQRRFCIWFLALPPNGLRYLRVGGRGQCLRAGKTRSVENAWKCRRIPHVRCTLCSAAVNWKFFCLWND